MTHESMKIVSAEDDVFAHEAGGDVAASVKLQKAKRQKSIGRTGTMPIVLAALKCLAQFRQLVPLNDHASPGSSLRRQFPVTSGARNPQRVLAVVSAVTDRVHQGQAG